MAKQLPETASRTERILAFMMIAMVGASIVSFFAVIAATFAGMDSADFSAGVWPAVILAPLFALPLAIALIVALVVVNARRRARNASLGGGTSAGRSPARGR